MQTNIVSAPSSGLQSKSQQAIWGCLLVLWFLILCFVPDPRPLSVPQWGVDLAESISGLSAAESRVVAAVTIRSAGLVLLGALLALARCAVPMRWAAPTAILGAPLIAVACLWINYGYYPIFAQVTMAILSSILGALIGLAFRKSRWPAIAALVFAAGVYLWGASTGISDDLYHVAAMTGDHLLEHSEEFPEGDDGFEAMMRSAFEFAHDNSHGRDSVFANRAAILALGVIVGEERVAEVAKREVEISRVPAMNRLRQNVTLRDRNDLARHFWVSAALTVLSGEGRSMSVGIAKELMDAEPGGSGFSFVDLTADQAGIRMATAATRDGDSATAYQIRVREGLGPKDLCPSIDGLPEGISSEIFEQKYGGLGGVQSSEIVKELLQRLDDCKGLR